MIDIKKIDDDSFELRIIEGDIKISRVKVFKNIIEEIEVNEKFRHISYGVKSLKYVIDYLANKNYDTVEVIKYSDAEKSFFLKNSFELEDGILRLKGLKKKKMEQKQLLNCSVFALIINIFLATMKILIGYIFNLNSIIADGINSTTDSLSTILAIFGIRISRKLEDEKYPFGYGKIEAILNLFIAFMIFISTMSVFSKSISSIFVKDKISIDNKSILIYLITLFFIILKLIQYFYVNRYAKRYKNEVLLTLSKDYLADILLGISVLVGVVLTIKLSYVFDIILSILISLYIMYQAFDIAKNNINILLEKQDENLIRKVRTIIMRNCDVFFCHDLYMIRSGKNIYMYADIRINKDYSLEKAHKIAEDVSLEVKGIFKEIKSINFHIEPIYI